MVALTRALATALLICLAVPGAGAERVVIHERDLMRMPGGGAAAPALVVPAEDRTLPVVAPDVAGAAADSLRRLDDRGLAHGFDGILYDNRDRGHSALDSGLFPRLARLEYGFDLIRGNADYGLAGGILFPAVVFGNSSTAVTGGPAPRSLPRLAMTTPGRPAAQARLYAANHLYVYPEHRDHDAVDLFPANWPYTIVSQGSSGSDQPFLEALAMTLAAFPPDTFARMQEDGLVAPTLQMILRSSLSTVATRGDYLSGAAHPAVFDAALLRPERMVAAAARLSPEAVPPMVRIDVVAEDFSPAAGLAGLDERLFDTPSAIARVWRSPAWERRMTLSASAEGGAAGASPTFTWRVLRGRADLIELTPLDPEGRQAELRVAWHDPFEVPGPEGPLLTSRVDVAVFASSGPTDSAPAILSISFPTHEVRRYGPTEDGGTSLVSVDYDAIGRGAGFDPLLHWSAPWTDVPVRDAAGAIVAWERTERDGGTRVVPAPAADGPVYRIDRSSPGEPVLVMDAPAP